MQPTNSDIKTCQIFVTGDFFSLRFTDGSKNINLSDRYDNYLLPFFLKLLAFRSTHGTVVSLVHLPRSLTCCGRDGRSGVRCYVTRIRIPRMKKKRQPGFIGAYIMFAQIQYFFLLSNIFLGTIDQFNRSYFMSMRGTVVFALASVQRKKCIYCTFVMKK